MLLDPIILSLCSTVMINTGSSSTPCQQFLNAASNQTKTTATINMLESYSHNMVESNISKNVLYPTLAVGAIVNSASQKRVEGQFPLEPLFDEVNFNLTETTTSVTIKWKWKF